MECCPAFLNPSNGTSIPFADLLYCLLKSGDIEDEEKRASLSVVWFVKVPVARWSDSDLILWVWGSSDVSARKVIVSFFVQYSLGVSLALRLKIGRRKEGHTLRHLCARHRQYCSMASYQHVPASQFRIQANRQLSRCGAGSLR
jgi:hypothetical protein